MHFVIYNLDKPSSADLRAKTREEHLVFMRNLGGKVKAGGPLLDANGEMAIGGMFVLEAENLDEAEATASADPYVQAGLFEMTSVRPWRWQTRND